MAKHRYGSKKGKSAKRVAAGRKLSRYNKLAAKIGKAAAKAQVFGGKRGRKPAKKGRKGTHRFGEHTRKALFKSALHSVQMWGGTLGQEPTGREIIDAENLMKKGVGSAAKQSEGERIREQAAKQVKAAKHAAAARYVAYKEKEKAAKEKEAAAKAAEAEIEAEARNIA